jgi:hypothetical protein
MTSLSSAAVSPSDTLSTSAAGVGVAVEEAEPNTLPMHVHVAMEIPKGIGNAHDVMVDRMLFADNGNVPVGQHRTISKILNCSYDPMHETTVQRLS